MEKKQLNLSAPLLSARRYSSPLRSCGEESRLESAPNSFPANKCLREVVKPGAVPFIWEQTPGRAKSLQVYSSEYEEPPRPPPGRSTNDVKYREERFLRSNHKFSGELYISRPPTRFLSGELPPLRAQIRSSSFSVHDTVKSAHVNPKDSDSGSETYDPTFSDALDALESYSMNCSTSGSEVPNAKPSSITDVSNHDFMMNRFLPAAKAMTLESPQYASKRHIVSNETPQLSKAIVPKIFKGPAPAPAPQKNMAITLYTGQDIGSHHSEEDDEEQGFDKPRNISVKSCGFFPWFCSSNALRLLNPVPAMKVKTKSALTSACKVGRLVKNASYKSPSLTNTKFPSTHGKHKVDHVTKSCELNHIESKPKSKSRPMFYSGELPTTNVNLQARNALSPYRNYKRSSVSPYRSESPHSPFQNGVGYLIVPKRVDQPDEYKSKTNDRVSFHQSQRKFQGGSPVTEKTVYVDSVNMIRARHSSGRIDIIKGRSRGKATCDTNPQRSSIECQTDDILSKINQSFGHAISSREVVVTRRDDPATQSPLPPPLPKSPSESWLSRNLNAVSPRNSVCHSHVVGNKFLARQQASQTSNTVTAKWETIVKTSHLRCDHGRYSEELVARVPK